MNGPWPGRRPKRRMVTRRHLPSHDGVAKASDLSTTQCVVSSHCRMQAKKRLRSRHGLRWQTFFFAVNQQMGFNLSFPGATKSKREALASLPERERTSGRLTPFIHM